MKDSGVDPESMKDYVDGFRWGCPPVRRSIPVALGVGSRTISSTAEVV